jgi:hypothetical protein
MPSEFFQGNLSGTPTVVRDPLTGSQFPGNLIPANRISPIVQKLQQYYITPNAAGLTNNFSASLPNNNTTNQTINRIDQNIGQNVRLFFRYQKQWMDLTVGSANPVNATISPVELDNYNISYTHTLTPTLVNDFRFGRQYFETSTLNYFAANSITGIGSSLGIPGFDGDVKNDNPGIPEFNINGFTGFGNSGTNWYQDDKTWQMSEQLSWSRGSHNIMMGVELRKLITGRAAANSPRGVFNFTGRFTGYGPADFLLGLPESLTTPAPQVRGQVASWRNGFFVLDNWQASRKLTLNYGLRYELPTVPYTVNGNATTLNPDQTALVPANPPVPGFKFINPNHKNFAPRFGFAYRMTEKTVVRGGYGIYYNPNQANTFTFLNTNPPFSTATTYSSLPNTPTLSLTNPTPTGAANPAPAVPDVIAVNWDLPTAYMNQWSLAVARELWPNAGFELSYLGSRSVHLDRSYYNNTPYVPGPGPIQPRRPNQRFGQIRTIQNDLVANYQGMTASLRQRFSKGLQFLASYTWSHTLDVATDSNGGGTPMNPYNWRLDYGNANWDIRNRFVVSYLYELPFFRNGNTLVRGVLGGWQINGISILQSGTPFNVTIASDVPNVLSRGPQRPDLVKTPTSNCGGGNLANCIDTSAFVMPQPFTYGNAGRNLLRGPHLFSNDLSVFKNFAITESVRFQLRGEAFNFTNSPQFSNPASVFGNANFGSITSTSIDNRSIQIGGKLIW